MEFRNLSKEQAKKLIAENSKNPNFVIIDVRTPAEFQEFHFPDAVNLDIYSPNFQKELDSLDKQKLYLVYCRSGNRSMQAIKIMERLRFEKVCNLKNGLLDW